MTRVDCVHTIVHLLPAIEDPKQIPPLSSEDLHSSENRPAILPPWEHFAALKSYVGGIAATGLKNILIAAYSGPEQSAFLLPFGFNAMMQEQVLRALRTLSPVASLAIAQDVIGQLLEMQSADWFRTNYTELDKIWDVKAVARSSLDLFLQLDHVLHLKELRISAEVSPDTHPDLRKYLEQRTQLPQEIQYPTSFSSPVRGGENLLEKSHLHLGTPKPPQKELEREKEIISQYGAVNNKRMIIDYLNPQLKDLLLNGRTISYKLGWKYYLPMILFMPVFILLITVLDPYHTTDMFFTILALVAYLVYFTLWVINAALVRLELTPDALTYRNIWGSKSCTWGDVTSIYASESRRLFGPRWRSREIICVESLAAKTIRISYPEELRSQECPRVVKLLSVVKLYCIRGRAEMDLKKAPPPA